LTRANSKRSKCNNHAKNIFTVRTIGQFRCETRFSLKVRRDSVRRIQSESVRKDGRTESEGVVGCQINQRGNIVYCKENATAVTLQYAVLVRKSEING